MFNYDFMLYMHNKFVQDLIVRTDQSKSGRNEIGYFQKFRSQSFEFLKEKSTRIDIIFKCRQFHTDTSTDFELVM